MINEIKYILGLDLHGTLLEPGEILREEMIEPITTALARLKNKTSRFICTGNDLAFVGKKIPSQILEQIDGHILETGCCSSHDKITEQVLTSLEEQKVMSELEILLREQNFPEINYFAHRLTTISMFCDQPKSFWQKITEFIKATPLLPLVHITYSSVAVDILPAGYNKHYGLSLVAGKKKTIGIADSMNDRALLEKSDLAFAPANIAAELLLILKNSGRRIVPLAQDSQLKPNTIYLASRTETQGVKEILDFLDRVL